MTDPRHHRGVPLDRKGHRNWVAVAAFLRRNTTFDSRPRRQRARGDANRSAIRDQEK